MIDERPITHATAGAIASDKASDSVAPSAFTVRSLLVGLCALAAIALSSAGAIELDGPVGWTAVGLVVAWSGAASLLATRRPHERVSLFAVAVSVGVAATVAAAAFDTRGIVLAVAVGALIAAAAELVALAPNGRFASPTQRRGGIAITLVSGATAVWLAAAAPDVPAGVIWLGGGLTGAIAIGVAWAACGTVTTLDRARLQWIGWGITVTTVLAVAALGLSVVTGSPSPIEAYVVGACAATAVGVSATGYRRALGVIADVLVHTIVAVGLVAFVAAVYLVVVVGLSGLPDGSEQTVLALSILAALVIAITVVPVQHRLHATATRRVLGESEAPDQTLDRFTTRMSRAIPMDELLLQLVESIQKTMKTTSAEVWTGAEGRYEIAVSVPHQNRDRIELDAESLLVAARAHVQGNAWLTVWVPQLLEGRSDRAVRFTSVSHLGGLLGFIVTERPMADVALDEEDENRVLVDIARQLGLALHNVRLDNALQASLDDLRSANEELVASRARIVAATDESRRRIERDLHDGAQQHLVALAVKVGLIRQLLDANRDMALGMLDELREDVQVTLTELRELAHGIYPPRLRDRGLADALTAAAGRSVLPTTVHSDELGRYGADIETAVYFCCLEAIQNAGKHAGPDARIDLTIGERDGILEFTVVDDGSGFDPATVSESHGFVNMRDRLGAFAGQLDVDAAPGHGATVRGRIPLP